MTVGGKQLDSREGYILVLQDDRQHQFFGEIAPLPGLDSISLTQCREQLCQILQFLPGHQLYLEQFDLNQQLLGLLPSTTPSPLADLDNSVRLGLESALLLLASHYGLIQLPAKPLEIILNGLFIPSADPDDLPRQLKTLLSSGFETIKVKIGRIAPEDEIEQIRQLVDCFDGKITLRFDGNRSLSHANYRYYHQHLESLPVEYVEEPLYPGLWEEALTVPWPLALDESLADFLKGPLLDIQNLPDQIRHIIVKPTAVPGIHGLHQLLAEASEYGIKAVVSSAFNTSIGLTSMGLISHLHGRQTAHGLDTLKYLAGDLLEEPLTIRKGKLILPTSLFSGQPQLGGPFFGDPVTC